ncbi:MAG: shikimate kinase [Flammeovirgaceae bacterium]
MNQKDRIYLIGMMGAGKTTLGKLLSEKLGYSFYDLDEEISKKEMMTIPEIFSKKGEDYFRELESNILKTLLPIKSVIATGGGAPCFFDNINFLLKNGWVIYLDVDTETLTKRVLQQKGERPLIQSEKYEEVLQILSKRIQQRKPFYEKAHLTFKGEIKVEEIIEELKALVITEKD